MTTFTNPVYSKLTAEVSVGNSFLVGAVPARYEFETPLSAFVSATASTGEVVLTVFPAGQSIYGVDLIRSIGFTGISCSSVEMRVFLAGTQLLSTVNGTAVGVNTPSTGSGIISMGEPLSVDTTLSWSASCSGGGVPTAGRQRLIMTVGLPASARQD